MSTALDRLAARRSRHYSSDRPSASAMRTARASSTGTDTLRAGRFFDIELLQGLGHPLQSNDQLTGELLGLAKASVLTIPNAQLIDEFRIGRITILIHFATSCFGVGVRSSKFASPAQFLRILILGHFLVTLFLVTLFAFKNTINATCLLAPIPLLKLLPAHDAVGLHGLGSTSIRATAKPARSTSSTADPIASPITSSSFRFWLL